MALIAPSILVVGLNHRTAPVEIREKFAIAPTRILETLESLTRERLLTEAVALSTCNRVEYYVVGKNLEPARRAVFDFLERRNPLSALSNKGFYVYNKQEAIHHLFEVCSGLDSMVVGETEIFGQVKEAYRVAKEGGRTGAVLNRLFQSAFSLSKQLRSETQIGRGNVSVGSVAVDLTGQIFGDLTRRRVMLLGAGEMSETMVRALQSRGVKGVTIVNRSFGRAEDLAQKMGGGAVSWQDWPSHCREVDILISSTSASHVVVTRQQMESVMKSRQGEPLFIIDIAVPRDVEREAGQIEGVYLYDIDDLQVIADQNLALRHREMARCRQIIRERVDQFHLWLEQYVLRHHLHGGDRHALPVLKESVVEVR
jgi:glutamyl-tRNA reductase